MSKRVCRKYLNTRAITIIFLAIAVLMPTVTHLSQTQQRPPLKGGVSKSGQQGGDVFNSNSRPVRKCDPNDCPCQAAQALDFYEKDCAKQLAEWDELIAERKKEIAEINAYPEMRNKPKLSVAKDPDILMYLRRKLETQNYCNCTKQYLPRMCSLSQEELLRLQEECRETGDKPYRPYPTERGSTKSDQRDPLGFPSAEAAPPPQPLPEPVPTIDYKPQCDRQLLFVNNPEKILSEYLTDKKGAEHRLVYQETVTKPSRLFFEHLNLSGGPIHYGVQLVNNTKKPVRVTIEGIGFTTGFNGGEPFRQLFTNRKAEVKQIEPGKTIWLTRTPSPVANNTFFSGVVDFQVQGGEVVLKAFVYRDPSELDKPIVFHGNLTDEPDNYKVYNGIIKCAELLASGVNFTIDDNSSGPLKVQYLSRSGFKADASEWNTHSLNNSGNFPVIKGDMFDIIKPGGEVIYAEGVKGKQPVPNWGNWGVVYRLSGEINNIGKRARCVSINLGLTSIKGIALAWRDEKGLWQQAKLENKAVKAYYKFLVPAGRKYPYGASFVLGGPSNSNLRNWVSVGDADQCR